MKIFFSKVLVSYILFFISIYIYDEDFVFNDVPRLTIMIFTFLMIWNLVGLFIKLFNKLTITVDKNKIDFSRDKFIDIMSKKYGIQLIIQCHPLDKYHFFKKKYKSNNNLKNTYNFYNNMFSIPFHVWMSDKQFKYLISSCRVELKKIRYLEK